MYTSEWPKIVIKTSTSYGRAFSQHFPLTEIGKVPAGHLTEIKMYAVRYEYYIIDIQIL